MSILFNQLENIKVGSFGNYEFVDIQRAHRETFVDNAMIFPANTANQNKNMAEKEIYAFSELCMLEVSIHIIRNIYGSTDNVDY